MTKMPTLKDIREKMDRTAAVAAERIDAERLARETKTARLRALRLAKETLEKSRPKHGRSGSR